MYVTEYSENHIESQTLLNKNIEQTPLFIKSSEWSLVQRAKIALRKKDRSNRANPLFILNKLIATGCLQFSRYNPKQETIGASMRAYGYNKNLGERQVRRLIKQLLELGLIRITKSRLLNKYELTDVGFYVHYYVTLNNCDKYCIFESTETEGKTVDEIYSDVNFEDDEDLNLYRQRSKNTPDSVKYVNKSRKMSSYTENININTHYRKSGKKMGNNKFMKSEKEAEREKLGFSVKKYVDKIQNPRYREAITILMKRLNISEYIKINLIEDLIETIEEFLRKNKTIKNICGLVVSKFKRKWEKDAPQCQGC